MRLLAPIAALLTIASMPLTAADLSFADLRFGAGVLSEDFRGASTTTVTNNGSTISTTRSSVDGRDADSNYRGQLQLVGGHLGAGGGLVYGIGVAVNHATWDNGSQNAHATTPTVDVLLGYGYAFTPAWHFELTPFAGYGRAYYSVSDSGSSSTSKEWDNYVEYGAKIGTYIALGQLVLGVEVPYMVGRFKADYNYDSTGNDRVAVSDDRRNTGFGLLVTIGGRF